MLRRGTLLKAVFFKHVFVGDTVAGLGLFAGERIRKHEKILRFGGRVSGKRDPNNRHCMRIAKRLFLLNSNELDDYINHSCVANSFIDFSSMTLIAAREIGKNEEITYNYCTTEYKMDKDFWFECRCNSVKCYKLVRGFYYLSREQRDEIIRYCSPYIRKLTHDLSPV